MEFDGLNLQDIERNKPVQVGWVTIKMPFVRRELYSYAAWFRDHELQPGRYPVIASRTLGIGSKNGDMQLAAKVPTKIVDACLISGFGGVNYGPDTAGAKEVGKESDYTLHVGSAYHIRACLFPEAKTHWEAREGEGALRVSKGRLHDNDDEIEFEWLPEFAPKL